LGGHSAKRGVTPIKEKARTIFGLIQKLVRECKMTGKGGAFWKKAWD